MAWIWLFVIEAILSSTCPVTIKNIGPIIGIVEIVAIIVFMVLTFFFAAHWWYGLVAVAIYFAVPFFTPRVDANNISDEMRIYSFIGFVVKPVLIVFMYLSLFNVI